MSVNDGEAKSDNEAKAEALTATLHHYADAYCKKNVSMMMELFVDSDEISVIGTGPDELCSGRAQVAELFSNNFAEATAKEFVFGWMQPSVVGDTGVIATTLSIHLDVDGEPLEVSLRWTVVAVWTPLGWRWLHRNASVAAGGQDDGAAYPTDPS